MDYRKEFRVEPGTRVRLSKLDPVYKGKNIDEENAKAELEKYKDKLRRLQFL